MRDLFANLVPSNIIETVVRWLTYEIPIAAGGDMRISVASLGLALVVLLAAFWVSRLLQSFVRRRIFSRISIDSGLTYTLERLLHYATVTFGVLLALRIGFGVDYTSVAVVVTALSVGIGLGLKEIASDVFAGFVLLFERPIRVGDRVRLLNADVEGNVVSIGLRTTKILNGDRLMTIVPNSKLTNDEYVNWSYTNEAVRIHVPIVVAYGSDVEAVRKALVTAATGIDKVIAEPAPAVRLVRFAESSLDFEVLVWTEEPTAHPQIRSDINFAIERALREAEVKFPNAQRDLHVQSIAPEIIEAIGASRNGNGSERREG